MNTNENQVKTIAFTGHRDVKHPKLPERLDTLLPKLYTQGYRHFRTGGAIGLDAEAALSVLRLRATHSDAKLHLLLPFPDQAKTYNPADRDAYEQIKAAADKITYAGDRYTRGIYHQRNRMLVDGADLCIAYQYKNDGGTHYTTQYARAQGVPIINIAD